MRDESGRDVSSSLSPRSSFLIPFPSSLLGDPRIDQRFQLFLSSVKLQLDGQHPDRNFAPPTRFALHRILLGRHDHPTPLRERPLCFPFQLLSAVLVVVGI